MYSLRSIALQKIATDSNFHTREYLLMLPDSIREKMLAQLILNQRLTPDMLINLAQQSFDDLTHLSLRGYKGLNQDTLQKVLQFSPNLKSIDLSDCPKLGINAISMVWDHCKNIKEICFESSQTSSHSSLKRSNPIHSKNQESFCIVSMKNQRVNLKDLTNLFNQAKFSLLVDLSGVRNNKGQFISSDNLADILENISHLRKDISIECQKQEDYVDFTPSSHLVHIAKHFDVAATTHLIFDSTIYLPDREMRMCLETYKKVKEITLNKNCTLPILKAIKSFEQIKKLHFKDVCWLPQFNLPLPSVKKVSFTNCSSLNQTSMKNFLAANPQLTSVKGLDDLELPFWNLNNQWEDVTLSKSYFSSKHFDDHAKNMLWKSIQIKGHLNAKDISDQRLIPLMTSCPLLQSISVDKAHSLTKDFLNSLSTIQSLRHLQLGYSKNLTESDFISLFKKLSKLETIKLHLDFNPSFKFFEALANCKSLKKVEIYTYFTPSSALSSTDLICIETSLLASCRYLKDFKYRTCMSANSKADQDYNTCSE